MSDDERPARVTLVVSLTLLLLLLAPAPADSCECWAPKPLSRSVRTESPFIFEGKVVEIVERSLHTMRTTSGGGSSEAEALGREVVFEVKRVWRGVTTKRIAVSAEMTDCMFPFEIDQTYLVFAGKDAKGGPVTNTCTRTVESRKAADVLALLGQATVPK